MKNKTNWPKLNRRTHLYLALLLIPWFFMYGFTALAIHHGWIFLDDKENRNYEWETIDVAPVVWDAKQHSDLNELGREICNHAGLDGAIKVRRLADQRIQVERIGFWSITKFVYDESTSELSAERQRFGVQQVLVRMHARGGYSHDSWATDLWAVMIDLVSMAILIWISSGLIMWWKSRQSRFWGAIALLSGIASFTLFMLTL